MTAQSISAQDIPSFPTPFSVDDFEIPSIPDFDGLTVDDVDHEALFNYMSEAVSKINSLPDSLFDNFGDDVVANESATQLFGYAKWLFSGNSANELLGPTLAPIGINLYILLTLLIFLVIAWVTIRLALLIFRFVLFIIREILRALPFVG